MKMPSLAKETVKLENYCTLLTSRHTTISDILNI